MPVVSIREPFSEIFTILLYGMKYQAPTYSICLGHPAYLSWLSTKVRILGVHIPSEDVEA